MARLSIPCLLVGSLCACSPVPQATHPVSGAAEPTTVIVIGTMHDAHYRMAPFNPDELRQMLAAAQPDVLAVEARPADLAAPDLGAAPLDIKQIVIPWARRHEVPVLPIDWWEEGTREECEAWQREMSSTEEGSKKLAAMPDEMAVHADRFPDPDQMTAAYVESAEFAEKDHAVRLKTTELFGEGPGNLYWDTRAAHMTKLLDEVLRDSPGKRVVVVTGAAHRGDFERALASRPDVRLVPASTLVGDTPVAYTGEEAEVDELQTMLLALVEGMKANRHPDSVDLTLVGQALEAAQAKVDEMPALRAPIAYAKAQSLYLARRYDEALQELIAAEAIVGDAQIYWVPLVDLCQLRRGNMLDLLGRRDEALSVYRQLPADSPLAQAAARFIAEPFERPAPTGSAPASP